MMDQFDFDQSCMHEIARVLVVVVFYGWKIRMMGEQVMVVEDCRPIMSVVEGVVSRDVYSLTIVDFQRIGIRPQIQETLNCPFRL